jgi:hypothetical protein
MTKRCYAGCRGECRCYPDEEDRLDLDIAEIAARDGAAAGDKYLTPVERHAWDDLKEELRVRRA